MEPLPEHLYKAITAEQLAIDIAALTDLTEDEVRQTGVQSNLRNNARICSDWHRGRQ